ncbi:hypothetical protein HY025_03110 [Candidatus Daviesbacteria bacterium]|nr:hypothetical protein [Candidatus Daviesbacteria bacterium]
MPLEIPNFRLVRPDVVQMNGQNHRMRLDIERGMPLGYEYQGFELLGLEGIYNGGFCRLKPFQATRTLLITGQSDCWDKVVFGQATFLAINPEGEIEEFQRKKGDQKVVHYGTGWIVTWIAGEEDATVLQLASPPLLEGRVVRKIQAAYSQRLRELTQAA